MSTDLINGYAPFWVAAAAAVFASALNIVLYFWGLEDRKEQTSKFTTPGEVKAGFHKDETKAEERAALLHPAVWYDGIIKRNDEEEMPVGVTSEMTHTYMTESIAELAAFLYDDLKKKNHLYGMQSRSEKIRKGALLVHKEVYAAAIPHLAAPVSWKRDDPRNTPYCEPCLSFYI